MTTVNAVNNEETKKLMFWINVFFTVFLFSVSLPNLMNKPFYKWWQEIVFSCWRIVFLCFSSLFCCSSCSPLKIIQRQLFLFSKETVVLHRCGVLQDNMVLSTGLIMWIGHHKEIWKLTFQALALLRSESRNCGLCVVYILYRKMERRHWLVTWKTTEYIS